MYYFFYFGGIEYSFSMFVLKNVNLSSSDNDVEDDDFEDRPDSGRRRGNRSGPSKERPLPPLLARVNGQIEVRYRIQCGSLPLSLRVAKATRCEK